MGQAKLTTLRPRSSPTVDAKTAVRSAEAFLVNEVGDLLMVDEPSLLAEGRPRWLLDVILGNAIRGRLGQVGTIAVDAETGEVLFDDGDRARIQANAERLSRPAAL